MKILVLDDNKLVIRAPADYFVDPHDYRTDVIVQVASRNAFMEMFDLGDWDSVWLDHDLGDHRFTGRDATKWIYSLQGLEFHIPAEFVITTMNPAVADSMASDLANTGVPVKRIPISHMRDHGIERGDFIPMNDRRHPIYHSVRI